MNSTLKSYSHYKPSHIPWLGDVPAHWEMRRTKSLLKERSQKGFPNEPLLAATQTKGVVRKEYYENRTVLALRDLHLLKLVCPGDFVISLRSFQGGIEYAHDRGIISPAYTILYPENSDIQGYLAWLFKSKPYIENLTLHVTGIRQGQNIDYGRLCVSKIPLPPLPEQIAIVRYLDHTDECIHRYTSSKERLIELLEEYRQAVIHHAVTRGLDPNVRLKPSDVEWLGDVPAHWEVRRLKHIFQRIVGGATPASTNPNFWDGDVVWITPTDVSKTTRLRDSIRKITQKGLSSCSANTVPSGSIIVTSRAPVGNIALTETELCTNQGCKALVVATEILNPVFGFHILSILKDELQSLATGTTFTEIATSKLAAVHLPLPPLSEQVAIVAYLDKATADIDAAIDRARREIELLVEYRTRLIADVVTGKVDVREVARLPDEVE